MIPLLNTLIISRSVGRMKRESYSRPGVLVLVPTRELAEQVAAVSEELAVGTTVKSLAVYGGDSLGKELSILRVCTTSRSRQIYTSIINIQFEFSHTVR